MCPYMVHTDLLHVKVSQLLDRILQVLLRVLGELDLM